ncbi:MAG: RHS repeat-associated core domain-containing protein [Chloroflexi bacterium]|nr:RHS repeat-associated core domain-containing protein [Chloroflexota bacterium]
MDASTTTTPHYNGRFYDPALGRFIQADPIVPGIANPQATNCYSYVANNPVRYNDPNGHCFIVCVAVVWAAFEIGSAVYDAYTMADTLLSPSASVAEKVLTAGLFAAGAVLPGGGYAAGGKKLLQAADSKLLNFKTPKLLGRHFEEHGAKLGYKTVDDYLAGANDLVARSDAAVSVEMKQRGTDSLYYDYRTNEYLSVDEEGVIRTYMKPETGVEYWLNDKYPILKAATEK